MMRLLAAILAALAARSSGLRPASGAPWGPRRPARGSAPARARPGGRHDGHIRLRPALRPALILPADVLPRGESFIGTGSHHGQLQQHEALQEMGGAVASEFQPSSGFTRAAREAQGLPWGVGSPRAGDSLPVFHYSGMPFIDVPKELEYSLETGDNIQTFGTAQQDIKLITQVLENVTNGFYIDSHAGTGEEGSNTLLLELTGWRGLCIEPRVYHFVTLWGKMRKAWLFLGAIAPHENATELGFDYDGNIDMLSGHKVHSYPLTTFLSEMGGRSTVDFWSLSNGGYEAEVLNETLLGGGKNLEFGVILVRFDGRRSGRGDDDWVRMRSKDTTEEIVFEIMHNASFVYIGGLDAYWVNQVSPRFNYKDSVFVNPSYFQKRGIPTPWKVKSAPPPALAYPRGNQSWSLLGHPEGYDSWDAGFSKEEEINKVTAYIQRAKERAQPQEPVAKASRVTAGSLMQ